MTERIFNEIKRGFSLAFDDTNEGKEEFLSQFQQFLEERGLRKIIPSLQTDVYNCPWKLANHLSQCQIYCHSLPSFIFPLELMNHPSLLMYYEIKNAPNLIVFIDDESPAAIFTKTGFLTLAGGTTRSTLFHAISICCFKILLLLRHLYPTLTFGVSGFEICNQVATTTILLHRICLPRLIDDLRQFGFSAQYLPDEINFVYCRQFLPFRPSITFCIPATGGINIIGFTKKFEAQYAILLLGWFLKKHCIPIGPINDKTLSLARAEKEKQNLKRSLSKKLKKQKKLEKWGGGATQKTSTHLP
jgi:hypothetical protein